MILRPSGIVIGGKLELGLELVMDGPHIAEVRPHTGKPENFVLSPAFVNAHSHLEYRGLIDAVDGDDYWTWIREITRLKPLQSPEEVRRDAHLAATENRKTGVALIAEHSDRPFAGEALAAHGVGGILFQEVITLAEHADPAEKLRQVEERAQSQRAAFGGPVALTPHAPYTVDPTTLAGFSRGPISIHVAESIWENELYSSHSGPIADLYRRLEIPLPSLARSATAYLDSLGLVRPGVQFVHGCALDGDDLDLIAERGVSVAHCPRSNARLRCPTAPIRELLDRGVQVGIGLDSPASSGPIGMFAEMRAAREANPSVTPEEIWLMATEMGARSLPGVCRQDWSIAPGSSVPLIKVFCSDARTTESLLNATPDQVKFVDL